MRWVPGLRPPTTWTGNLGPRLCRPFQSASGRPSRSASTCACPTCRPPRRCASASGRSGATWPGACPCSRLSRGRTDPSRYAVNSPGFGRGGLHPPIVPETVPKLNGQRRISGRVSGRPGLGVRGRGPVVPETADSGTAVSVGRAAQATSGWGEHVLVCCGLDGHGGTGTGQLIPRQRRLSAHPEVLHGASGVSAGEQATAFTY